MMRNTVKTRQNSLSKRIVSLTIFLDALFLVLVMATLSFVYFNNLDKTKIQSAEVEAMSATSAIEAFLNDTETSLSSLAQDSDIISYLQVINTANSPIISDQLDPNYVTYQSFLTKIESVLEYSASGVYDYIFVASDNNCSTGIDGCYVGANELVSDNTWALHQRPWFIDLASSDYAVSYPYVDSITGEYVITFVQKVYNGDSFIGYIGIDVLVTNISNVIYAYDFYSDSESKSLAIFIHRDTDIQILHFSDSAYPDYTLLSGDQISAQDQIYGFQTDGMSSLLSNITEDTGHNLDLFGKNYYVSENYINTSKWTVTVLIENGSILGIETAFIIMLGLILGLMVFISLILGKKINKTLSPINDILDSIDEIKNGNYDVSVHISENNELKYVADALNIMSKEIGKQVNLVYQSYVFDPLTGLKNRRAIHPEIDDEILVASDKVAICLLDVDNLKNINVTKGQNIGDELLKAIALRLTNTLRNKKNIYFNGGNEFVFLIPSVKHLEAVESEIKKVLESFQEPLIIKNIKVEVKIHIGISIFPSDGKNMTELMKKCDTALYKAREAGLGKYVFYNDQLTREVNYRTQVNDELATALERKQLMLKYQPLIDNKNEIYGFEALVRWKSPVLGDISPQIFIAHAEESHMIIPIGTWILREACETQVKLKKMFQKAFVISVNVSPVQIIQKDFLDLLKRIIKETDIDPKELVLEITEGVLIESTIYLEETINFLHEIGAKIALDDFGTGYASLTYLRKIPFDNLKIDKSFVDGIFANKKDHSIIGTIVELVHNLEMKVVAEGVETRKQYEYLKQIQTDIFQGFLFSKALEFNDLIKYIDQFYKVAKTKRIDVFGAKDYHE